MKKRIYFLFLSVFAIVISFSSCIKENSFDETLLIGKWQRTSKQSTDTKTGIEYWRYDVGGTGVTWDTYDDVTENEAQSFKWTLDKSDLTHIHIMETTGEAAIPKTYRVIELNASSLKYEDDYNTFSFTKVK